MKKIGKLKLNQLSKAELENREMNALRGGSCTQCTCSCLPPQEPQADHDQEHKSNSENGPSSY